MARTRTGQKIPIDKLQASLAELEKLEEKPKEELTLRESVYFLRAQLQAALKKGYNYQDISDILAGQEIKISAATLKQYLTEIDQEESSHKRGAKSKQVKQVSSAAKLAANTLSDSSQEPNADLEAANLETPQKQSSTYTIEPEQKITQVGKRKNLKTSQSKASILDDFNQY